MEPTRFAIEAEANSQEIIDQISRNIDAYCKSRNIKRSDLINTMSKMGLERFAKTRVSNYDQGRVNSTNSGDLSEICLIAVLLEVNPFQLMISDIDFS